MTDSPMRSGPDPSPRRRRRSAFLRSWSLTLTLLWLVGQVVLLGPEGCSEDKSTGPEGVPGPFVLGDTSSVSLRLVGRGHWDDPLTGLRFVFPEGALGRLTRGPIQAGPARPWEGGAGFYLAYTGEEPVYLRLPHAHGGLECLLAYGTPFGSWSDGQYRRWFAPPVADTVRGGTDSLDLMLTLRRRSGSETCEESNHYWLFRFPAGTPMVDSLRTAVATARAFLAAWIDSLDEPQRTDCRFRMEGHLAPTFYPDGNHYTGFLRRCGDALRPMARIGLRPSASAGTIAHQVGHYMTHLLVGEDAYLTLEKDAYLDPRIGTPRYQRLGVIEDYARYHEYLLTGAIEGAGDPGNPAEFFTPAGGRPSSEETDIPSLQGYGVLLLHAMSRRDSTMTTLAGASVRVPVVGLDYGTLAANVIARGAKSTEGLRGVIEAYLSTIGKERCLPVLAAATGWCYFGHGVVKGRTGLVVSGATVRDLIRVGDREYAMSGDPAVTDSAGFFQAHRLFSGPSTLRVTVPQDSFEISRTVNWIKSTHVELNLTDLIAWGYLSEQQRLGLTLTLGFETAEGDTVAFSFDQKLVQTQGVFTPNSIYIEDPFTWPCAPGTPPSECWVLDSLEIEYDLADGRVEDLGFRVHNLSPSRTDFTLRARGPLQASMPDTKHVHFVDMQAVSAQQARVPFAMQLTDSTGTRYSEADLVGESLQIWIRAYCG